MRKIAYRLERTALFAHGDDVIHCLFAHTLYRGKCVENNALVGIAGEIGDGAIDVWRQNAHTETLRLLPEDAPDAVLAGLQVLFVAGLPEGESRDLSRRARALGVLVNVEDMPALCDFHVPAIVRRGELLLTASTGGRAPGLARVLREALASQFGPEWTARLKELSQARARWRSEGLSPAEVSRQVRRLIERMGWL